MQDLPHSQRELTCLVAAEQHQHRADDCGALARFVITALTDGMPERQDAAWWSLVMGAAASIEDAANCLRDPAAKKQAEGAAKHYREAAQKLWNAAGAETGEGHQS